MPSLQHSSDRSCRDITSDPGDKEVKLPGDFDKKHWWGLFNPYVCYRKKCLLWRVDNCPWIDPECLGNVYRCRDTRHYGQFHICGQIRWDQWSNNRHYELPNSGTLYRCPVTTRAHDGKLVCEMTGYVLEDQNLPDFGPVAHWDNQSRSGNLLSRKERRWNKRFGPYSNAPKGHKDQLYSDDRCDLLKDPDDKTLYTCIVRGEQDILCGHFSFLDEWLSEDQIRLFIKFFILMIKNKITQKGSAIFRKPEQKQIWNCIYQCVTKKQLDSTYRLYGNLARNINLILAVVCPENFNLLKL